MEHLSKRQIEILRLLKKENRLTSEQLGQLLHVSGKTIRNDIKEINGKELMILANKGSGYYLNDAYNIPDVVEQETELSNHFTILKKLLAHDKINFFDLADELYISETTLVRNIQELNEIIAKRNASIQIKRENNYLHLDGDEETRRQVSTYFLMHEIEEYDFDLQNYTRFFQAFDLAQIQTYVLDFNKLHELTMKDFETISFVMHVAIMLERVIQGNELSIVDDTIVHEKFTKLAVEFTKGLQQFIEVSFSEPELNYLSCLFAGKLPMIGNKELEEMRTFEFELMNDILDHYDVDLKSDQVFVDNFLIHLMGLRNRMNSNTFLNNPLIGDIKKHFPVLYDISVYIAMRIQERFQSHLYEDEIGYITLHLMGSLERLHKSNVKKIVVLSPMGEAAHGYVRGKLSNIHELKIEICDILSMFDTKKIAAYEPDLIVSFLKMPKGIRYPVYVCDNLLSDHDLEHIYQLLKKQDQSDSAKDFFDSELFFVNQEFSDKEAAICFLCEALYKQGYVERDYVHSVLKREETASTAYGNLFAIPHPIEKKAKKNMIAICSLNKAVAWNNQKVKLIFLFSLSKTRSDAFDKLFEQLVGLLDDEAKVKQLIKIEEFHDFMKVFME